MHPPSPQLLRSMRSALRAPAGAYCRPSRYSISPALIRFPCQTISNRYLSYTPWRFRPADHADNNSSNNDHDSSRSRKVSEKPQSPPRDRRFALSTADLKPPKRSQRPQPGPESEEGLNEAEDQGSSSGGGRASSRAGREHGGRGGSGEGQGEAKEQRADLRSLDVFADVSAPTTGIDACLPDGFHLNNGLKITHGDGCLLVDGEVFTWRPWEAATAAATTASSEGKNGQVGKGAMINEKGQWEIGPEAFGVLSIVWPRPDLLMLGLGATVRPISPATRRCINELGVRIEVLDTRNAAAQFNLLATERGVREVAAALIPMGRR